MEFSDSAKVSVLIVNWRSKDYLRKCLKSLEETCLNRIGQIVVVDGGSFDGCGEMLATEFPNVDFIQSPENVGFGRSNNLGFQSVRKEWVWLLNPDTEVRPGALDRMCDCLEGRSDVGMVGPTLLNTDGTLQNNCRFKLPTPLGEALDSEFLIRWTQRLGFGKRTPAPTDPHPSEVEAVSGASMLMPSDEFRRLGGFRREYFMYAEDMDLCFRVRQSNRKIIYQPAAVIIHHGGASSNTQVNGFSIKMMRIALYQYMRFNHGIFTAWCYRILQSTSALFRMIVSGLGLILTGGQRRAVLQATFAKWLLVLRWSLGLKV